MMRNKYSVKIQVSKVGYRKTQLQIPSIVESVARKKDVLHSTSDGWWQNVNLINLFGIEIQHSAYQEGDEGVK